MSSENQLVVKLNALVEAKYKLTMREQKIVLYLISKIRRDDEEFKTYTLPIKEFSEMLDLKGKAKYTDLRKVTDQLQQRLIRINTGTEIASLHWLSLVVYKPDEGVISFRFDPYLKPYLLKLRESFTSYQLKNILKLSSSYAIRIYELLKQYERIKERTVSLEELREMLGATDVYPEYANFKQRVLNPAMNELKEKTDLSFEYEEIKVRRKTVKIKFIINSKSKNEEISLLDYADLDLFTAQVESFAKKRRITISSKQIEEWRSFGEDKVIKVIEQIKGRQDIAHPVAYITQTVKRLEEPHSQVIEEDQVSSAIKQFILNASKSAKVIPSVLFEDKLQEFMMETAGLSKDEAAAVVMNEGEKIKSAIKSNRLVTN